MENFARPSGRVIVAIARPGDWVEPPGRMAESKRFQILFCDGPSCGVCHGSEELIEFTEARVEGSEALRERVDVAIMTCFGRCDDGPNLLIRPLEEGEDGSLEPDFEKLAGVRGLYLGMTEERVTRVLDEHVGEDRPIDGWVEEYW